MIEEVYKEYFIFDSTQTLTGGTGIAFQNNTIKIDSDAAFEWIKTTYVATNDRIKIRAKDEVIGRYLMRGVTDIKCIAGRNTLPLGLSNSFMPAIWPKPYIIGAGGNLTIEASDYSGVGNTFRLALHGSKVRRGVAPWKRLKSNAVRVPHAVGFNSGAVTVAANSTTSQTIEVDVDAHFIVHKVVGIRTSDALISITEGNTGKSWMNTAIHIDNVIGNGSFPNILPSPRFIPKGSVILINIQDLSGAANVIDITLIGEKIYG